MGCALRAMPMNVTGNKPSLSTTCVDYCFAHRYVGQFHQQMIDLRLSKTLPSLGWTDEMGGSEALQTAHFTQQTVTDSSGLAVQTPCLNHFAFGCQNIHPLGILSYFLLL